ncbi:MAG TPA: hypothetical protein DCQ50_16235 [Chryseobacterium sp.]|nr:hypothetical protein [Chryseobacterium sp.]
MSEHQFILEPYKTPSSRYTCPLCGRKRNFSRYIDVETNRHIADHVGRCNREQNCGYHYTPRQYFNDNATNSFRGTRSIIFTKPLSLKPSSTISMELIIKSLNRIENNHFITYLNTLFDDKTVNDLIDHYKIGTSKYWKGAVVFWQIDHTWKVKAGKVMLYDPESGCRMKKPYNHISWVHSILKIADYNLQQCFFGEHLLDLYPERPISIVESEKTAIIASVYFPEFIWIATGGKHGCKWTSHEVWKVLKSRKVVLWPDLNAFQDWEKKAELLKKQGLNIAISNLLEDFSTEDERASGLDIADYLIRFPYKQNWKEYYSRGP